LLGSNVDVEIDGRIEISDRGVVDVEKLVVEKRGEVLFRGRRFVEKSLRW
jgi:hypothetical protein